MQTNHHRRCSRISLKSLYLSFLVISSVSSLVYSFKSRINKKMKKVSAFSLLFLLGFVITVASSGRVPDVETCSLELPNCKCTYETKKNKPDLYSVVCDGVQLDDVTTSQMLTTFARHYSDSTPPIKTVSLKNNGLTRVPREVAFFSTRLQDVNLSGNAITSLHHRDIDCTIVLESLDLSSNKLKTIEMRAFQGDCGGTKINLSRNKLTRFESAIFQPLLTQMALPQSYTMSKGGGFIDITENPIDCETDPCHLAWLVRDNPQLLKWSILHGAICSNGTDFHHLSRSGFNNCPAGDILNLFTSQ